MAAFGAASNEGNLNSRSAEDLYIRNDKDLEDFWRAVLPDFVRTVNPNESSLQDMLFGVDILTESDLESLSGKEVVTRADQARKLAVILMTYDWNEFMSQIAPALCDARYAHIIPERYWIASDEQRAEMTSLRANHVAPVEQCLRHLIQRRIRPATLADMLFHHHCLSLDDYKKLILSSRNGSPEKWTILFSAFAKSSSPEAAKALEDDLRKCLSRRKPNVPDTISNSLLKGFPCCCKKRLGDNFISRRKDDVERLGGRPHLSPFSSLSVSDVEPMSDSPNSTLRSVSDTTSVNSDSQDNVLPPSNSQVTASSQNQQLLEFKTGQLLDCSLHTAVSMQASATAPSLPSEQLLRGPSSKQRKTLRLPRLGKRKYCSLFSKTLSPKKTSSVCVLAALSEISADIRTNRIQALGDGRFPHSSETLEENHRVHLTNNFGSNRFDLNPSAMLSTSSLPVFATGCSSSAFTTSSTTNSIQTYPTGFPQVPSHTRLFEYLQWTERKWFIILICVLAMICQLITIVDHLAFLFGGLNHNTLIAISVLGVLASFYQFFSPVVYLAFLMANRPFQRFLADQIFSFAQELDTHPSTLPNAGSGHGANP